MIQRFAFSLLSIACASAAAQSTSAPSTSALPAGAPQSPYYIGVQQSFARESNPFFAPNGTPKVSDWFSTTTLRAGATQPISRQRFFANGELRYNRYGERDELNNTGYSLLAGVDIATIERISGTLTAHAERNRTRLINQTSLVNEIAGANLERSEELRGLARLGGPTALTFELGGNFRQVAFSKTSVRDYNRTGAHAAALYRLSSATMLGVGVAGAKSTYVGDKSTRREVYGQGGWTPSASTDFQLRLGATQVRYDVVSSRDFQGLTGSLIWNWRPTAKIALVTTAARDVGQDIGFLRLVPGQSISAADFSTLTNTLGVRATYEATSKILVDTGLTWSRRNIDNGFTNTSPGTDTGIALSLGARWAPTRQVSVGCQLSREQRDAKSFNTTNTLQFNTKFANDTFGCFGAYTLY